LNLEQLSDEAGAILLRDNGVWGTDIDLEAAAHEFGGHALTLALLASYLRENHFGDARRRDQVEDRPRGEELSRYEGAKRVLDSYDSRWFTLPDSTVENLVARQLESQERREKTIMRSIMLMVGLFDRPADSDSLRALRTPPPIEGLTEALAGISSEEWDSAVARLRGAQLLAPESEVDRDKNALDAHDLAGTLKLVGQEGSFRGTVSKFFEERDGDLIVFDFDPNYRTALTAVLRNADFQKFPDVKALDGKEIVVSGKFVDYHGKAQIELTDPKQIRTVK